MGNQQLIPKGRAQRLSVRSSAKAGSSGPRRGEDIV
nr:MAG TPA: hypothetical protein [Caudoviricetes sp.]